MKVLHIAASLDTEWGGPTQVITGLTDALAKKGVKVSIFAPMGKNEGACINKLENVDVNRFPKDFLSRFWTSHSSALAKALRKEAFDFDLLHIHEIWHHPHFAAYQAAKLAKKKFIITIHGELEPWGLNHKAFKKKIYSALIQRRILKEASALHAITEDESKKITKFVDNDNIFIIPNGLNVEEFEKLPPREWIEDLYPDLKGKKVILFLGRIHPSKGLDILAKAFKTVLKKKNNIQLVIAGPDNKSYKSQIVEILKSENAIDNTTFTGTLTGNNKLGILNRADIFVLPSYSEGFSISTLEAMACGIPVLITKCCNFPEVEKTGAGKIIDASHIHLSEALIDLLDSPKLSKHMGNRGKRLVREKYTWDNLAEQMISSYEEILGG